MNPMDFMKIMNLKNQFESRHPKAVSFVNRELMGSFPEGTVLEITLTRPGEAPVSSNLRVTAEDLEMMAALREMAGKSK